MSRKKEIIQTARRLFLKRRYDQTSMQDLIESLGIAKGTLYHHFPSKKAILQAVVEDMVNELIEKINPYLKKARGNALTRLKKVVAIGRSMGNEADILEELHKQGNETLHTELIAEIIKRLAPIYADLITQGIKEKLFKTDHPLECAEFIIGGVQFLTDEGIYPWKPEELKRRGKAFPHLIENMVGAKRGSFSFLN